MPSLQTALPPELANSAIRLYRECLRRAKYVGHQICLIKDLKTGQIVLKGIAENGLYRLPLSHTNTLSKISILAYNKPSMFSALKKKNKVFPCIAEQGYKTQTAGVKCALVNKCHLLNTDLMHRRLGHPNNHTLYQVLNHCKIPFKMNKRTLPNFCESWLVWKVIQVAFSSN